MAAALSPRQNGNLSAGGALAQNLVDHELNYRGMDRDRIRINMIGFDKYADGYTAVGSVG